MVLENASLFLDLDQGILQLASYISHCPNSGVLMVVICQDAMSVANQIAGKLKMNVMFSAVDLNIKTIESRDTSLPVDFDYDVVRESGRDIPQNFIVHQEQNLRMNLISIYAETYESLAKTYPDKLIVLVDQLTNIDTAVFPCLIQKYAHPSGGNRFFSPAIRKFVFLHISNERSVNSIIQGFDIIIEHTLIE